MNYLHQATSWIATNPKQTAAIAVPAAVAAAPFVIVLPVLGAMGFTAGGVVAGSVAAGMQAGVGNVAVGSAFAFAQSAAAGGAAAGALSAVSGAFGGVATLVGAYTAGRGWVEGEPIQPEE